MPLTRRRFLKVGLSSMAWFTLEATTPNWIARAARAAGSPCFRDGRILVIVQQAGGVDGLNMAIPRTDPVYYDDLVRPTLRVPAGQELNLDGLNGLHPRMANLADWYQQGKLAVVNNVGYANPNLSHFTATDYWEFGGVPGQVLPREGWVAQFFDNSCEGAPDPEALRMVVAGKSSLPDALSGSAIYTPPAIQNPANYVLDAGSDRDLRLGAIHDLNNQATIDPQIDFLQRSSNLAEASIDDVAVAAAMPILVDDYSADSLGNGLKMASQIIRAGFDTSVFYVSQGGYDTHANQVLGAGDLTDGDHPQLLAALDQSLNAFLSEMQLSGNLDRVVVMTFSEFGRRVAENGSQGTDHGAANCLLLAGGGVAGGVYGGQPDLQDLIKGNLKHKIDFRSVYSAVMEGWLGQQAAAVFGQTAYDDIIAQELAGLQFLQNSNAVRSPWRRYA
jgi:uncharacterized protein (DUF1501 family)